VLARSNFSDPTTAIPSALSSLFHSLIASTLAVWWKQTAEHAQRNQSASEREQYPEEVAG